MSLRKAQKVIYLSHQQYMLEAGIKLYERYQWKPVYWFVDEFTEPEIKRHFPGTITHHFIDAIKGIRPAAAQHIAKGCIDELLLDALAVNESIALNMMERNDSSDSFSHSERVALYHHHLEHWLGVLDTLQPDLIIFEEEPHQATDYVLYALAKLRGIETVMFVRTSFMGRMFPIRQFETGSTIIHKAYQEHLGSGKAGTIALDDDITSFITTLNSTYDQAIKVQLYDQLDKIDALKNRQNPLVLAGKKAASLAGKAFRFPRTVTNLFKEDPNSDQKHADVSFAESKWNNLEVMRINKQTFKKKLANKTYYEQIQQSSPNLDVPYVLCALSYQPEKTTSPMGGHFVNQLLMIKMLRQAMPPHWKLYVKDHISQFSWYTGFGEQHRSPAYYDEIRALPGTELVSLFYDTFNLIDHAKAVATVTGSIGFEALIRKKPVLTFGYPWYKNCEGELYSGRLSELKEHMARIEQGYTPAPEKVRAFIEVIQEHTFPGVVGGKTIQKQAGEAGKNGPNSEAHINAIEALLHE
jgi:hypothetical protein